MFAPKISFLQESISSISLRRKINLRYLQPIITQYFIDNKSEIWLLFLIAHSKKKIRQTVIFLSIYLGGKL